MADTQPHTANLVFEDNLLLPMLYGENNAHLERLESQLAIAVSSRGNVVALSGNDEGKIAAGKQALTALYDQLKLGQDISLGQVDAAIRMALHDLNDVPDEGDNKDVVLKTFKKTVKPYSPAQAAYMQALQTHEMVFAVGPAGTGKTYMAVAMAVAMYMHRKVDRIILSRPAVEAGERLGFLPGDLKEKVDPYLRPLYDALYDMMPAEKVVRAFETGEIEIAPLAFMRGRTLSNAYVILDESQNTTPVQMKMFLTRLGENSRMVITGDLSQVDLPHGMPSGLRDATNKLKHVDDIRFIFFSDKDVVRHPLVAKIVKAYADSEDGKSEDRQADINPTSTR